MGALTSPYICLDCGYTFFEPDIEYEIHDELDWGRREAAGSHCPACGGDYEEASQCEECGEWFLSRELDDGLCEDCRKFVVRDE